jgi:hypothetical protein
MRSRVFILDVTMGQTETGASHLSRRRYVSPDKGFHFTFGKGVGDKDDPSIARLLRIRGCT